MITFTDPITFPWNDILFEIFVHARNSMVILALYFIDVTTAPDLILWANCYHTVSSIPDHPPYTYDRPRRAEIVEIAET